MKKKKKEKRKKEEKHLTILNYQRTTMKLSLLPHYLYMRDIIDCPLH